MQGDIHVRTIGIHSPGDMGHALGHAWVKQGFDVIACLQNRSPRTRELSQKAGIREAASLHDLVNQADVVLSILVPAQAEAAAEEIAAAIRETRANPHFVDCNAISPASVIRIANTIQSAGGLFSDASIIGDPPGRAAIPRLYVSGPMADRLQPLGGDAIVVKSIGPEIGQASGIKMCYAALTKGTFALHYALAMVAHRLNLLDELLDEFEHSQRHAFERMHQFLPKLPAKAARWIGEMEQIASTFQDAEVTPLFHQGAAAIYELIHQTTFGSETPETIDATRTLADTIATISKESAKARGR